MKRKIYTPLLLTALFMSTLSQTVPGTTANAAKKPALSKTKVSVYTGKKAKVSIKKIAKKTKVTWKRTCLHQGDAGLSPWAMKHTICLKKHLLIS